MLFSTEFSKAVKKARVSLEAGGANLYMNGDSVNAAYYQGYYNGQPAYVSGNTKYTELINGG